MSYTADDPVDLLRHICQLAWDLTLFTPKPTIANRDSLPNINVLSTNHNFVRFYEISEQPEYMKYVGYVQYDSMDTVGVVCDAFTKARAKKLLAAAKVAINTYRNNPHPDGNEYQTLEIGRTIPLHLEKHKIFTYQFEVRLFKIGHAIIPA